MQNFLIPSLEAFFMEDNACPWCGNSSLSVALVFGLIWESILQISSRISCAQADVLRVFDQMNWACVIAYSGFFPQA